MEPANRSEREKLFYGCLKGIISSLIEMKPNMELLESLFHSVNCTICLLKIKNGDTIKFIFIYNKR